MARVTVEDCVSLIPNRFELVMMSAQRARELHAGAVLQVARDNDKNPVVALREIADEKLDLVNLKDTLVRGHQNQVDTDEPEDDIIELMAGEQGWIQQAHSAETEGGDEMLDEVDMGGEDEDVLAENEFGNDDLSGPAIEGLD